MATNKSFIVPEGKRKEFDLLVQRANRRIMANMKYIQQEDIRSEAGQRALVSDYATPGNWATPKQVFSRSKKFESEKIYKDYVRHISQWGAKRKNERSVESVKEGYYKAIIKALTTAAIDNGNGVLTKTGRLPGNIAKEIKGLTLEQMANFFEHSDPTEEIESQGWASDMYFGVDRDEFTSVTKSYISHLKQLFPGEGTMVKAKKKRKTSKSKKKKSSKSRKRKKTK